MDAAGLSDAATLTAPPLFSHIRFGTYYADLVIPAAQQYQFHPLFVWSLIREESFFEHSIRSPAGARGLMQIMPATGQDIAYRMGWPIGYTENDLDRPWVSISWAWISWMTRLSYLSGDTVCGPGSL